MITIKNLYSKVISDYIQKMKENFIDELEMIFIIGSSASTKVIENWSDIDVILVIDDYNFDTLDKIKKLTNNFLVKIETTIYSKKEFENIETKNLADFSCTMKKGKRLVK